MTRHITTNEYDEGVRGSRCIPLAHWTTVQVAGRNRATFLHNMCTNDIRSLSPGGGCEAFFTDVKGKIVAHAFVLVGDEAIQLVMVPDSAARLIAHLDRYIIREDVQLEDVSSTVAWTLLCGFNATEEIGKLVRPPKPEFPEPWCHRIVAPWSHELIPLGRLNRILTRVVQCPLPWCGGFLLGCGSNQLQKLHWWLTFRPKWYDPETWNAIRVESDWPLWGVDFDDANLPQEVNRDATAIHFRKGCYLGQETVARIDALGHVNKRLVQVRFTGDNIPPPGAELTRGDKLVGKVTSSCWSPAFNAPVALAMVQRGSNDIGATMQCGEETAEVIAESLADFVWKGLLPGNTLRDVQYNYWSEPWTKIR